MGIITSDKEIFKRYKTKDSIKDYPRVKICPHCGKGKLHLVGRIYTSCPFCRDIAKFPRKIRRR